MAADNFPQDVLELQAYLGPVRRASASRRCPARHQGAAVDPRLEHVRRPARGRARLPVRLRVTLRAAGARRGAGDLPPAASSPRQQPTARTRSSASTSSPPRRTPRRAGSPPRSRCRSPTSHPRRPRPAPPIDDIDTYWTPQEKLQASHMLACSDRRRAATVRAGLQPPSRAHEADELMIVSDMFDRTSACGRSRSSRA
jgi:hypothetical protein